MSLKHHNYNHVRLFFEVARFGSIREASRQLRRTESTISIQIKKFEDAFGEKLFLRSGRNLSLSEAGRKLFRICSRTFGALDPALELNDPALERGKLEVDVSPFFPVSLFQKWMKNLSKKGLNVEFQLRSPVRSDRERSREGTIFAEHFRKFNGYRAIPLVQEEWLQIINGAQDAVWIPTGWSEAEVEWLTRGRGGVRVNRFDSLSLAIAAVAAGEGTIVLPASAVRTLRIREWPKVEVRSFKPKLMLSWAVFVRVGHPFRSVMRSAVDGMRREFN